MRMKLILAVVVLGVLALGFGTVIGAIGPTSTTIDPAQYDAEDWLDVEERHLHQYMEVQTARIAAHIRGTRAAWKRLEGSGIKLTEEQKLAMVDEGNVLRVEAKAKLAKAPEDLRAWDVPEDLRKVEEPKMLEEIVP